jgi:hypothetical protein
MEAFADTVASQTAGLLRYQNSILVYRDENLNCGSVNQGPAADSDDSVYVLTYSEGARTLCLTVYGVVADRSTLDAITIRPDMRRNYGRTVHCWR